MKNNKIRIFCDVDDTLWDLLPHWIEHNNLLYESQYSEYTSVYPKLPINYHYTPVQKLSTDLSIYNDWNLHKYFKEKKYSATFFSLLNNDDLWSTIQVPPHRIETLKKINDCEDIELYIVTSMKTNHSRKKLERFKELFPFIEDKQIITCHDKWVLDGDIWIDDKPETLIKCSEKGKVIKINKPYNQNIFCDLAINDFSELFFNDKFANLLERIYEEHESKV